MHRDTLSSSPLMSLQGVIEVSDPPTVPSGNMPLDTFAQSLRRSSSSCVAIAPWQYSWLKLVTGDIESFAPGTSSKPKSDSSGWMVSSWVPAPGASSSCVSKTSACKSSASFRSRLTWRQESSRPRSRYIFSTRAPSSLSATDSTGESCSLLQTAKYFSLSCCCRNHALASPTSRSVRNMAENPRATIPKFVCLIRSIFLCIMYASVPVHLIMSKTPYIKSIIRGIGPL
mmetsp:Transcript_31941/g.81264  ORF Transcript_31941/g.81264 Transcript_31941/m.81264 type:complete len:229 (+) Transcript_31941:1770-2456(+)